MMFSPEKSKREGFFISEIGELAYADIPSFWNDGLSKAYNGDIEPKSIKSILELLKRKV
jgi:hypothetical protein